MFLHVFVDAHLPRPSDDADRGVGGDTSNLTVTPWDSPASAARPTNSSGETVGDRDALTAVLSRASSALCTLHAKDMSLNEYQNVGIHRDQVRCVVLKALVHRGKVTYRHAETSCIQKQQRCRLLCLRVVSSGVCQNRRIVPRAAAVGLTLLHE
jgi:hypothetical protein